MSRTRGEEETVEKWRGFLVEMQVKRGGGGKTRQEAKTKSKQKNMGTSMFTSRRFGKGGCGRDGHGHRVGGWMSGWQQAG